ncbi:MAG: hypothetical protein QNJ53_17575 [Pleurocapsa sp. MO_192.B19]|nr:hypothetical protein [Pleurocapsa sp. MO_192.B19]
MKGNHPQVYQEWLRVVIRQMPHLSKPQALVLGDGSFCYSHDSSLWFIHGDSFFGPNVGAARKYC